MYTLLTIVATIVSLFLVIMVLLQSSKGGGLAGTFGGAGNVGHMFGSRRTADFLSKGTWWLGGIVAVMAIVINLFFLPGQVTTEQRESIIQGTRRQVPTQPALPPQTEPAPGGNQQETPAP
jgi:preprotein translocase subunit SecG